MSHEVTFRLGHEVGIPALVISGRIGPGDLRDFQVQLEGLCTQRGTCLILNMLDCPYLPSMGIPPLIWAATTLSTAGRKLLIAAQGDLLDIFRVLRLDKRLLIKDSLDECVRSALIIAS